MQRQVFFSERLTGGLVHLKRSIGNTCAGYMGACHEETRPSSHCNASCFWSWDAFMGIYKPLKRGSSGTNLLTDESAAYFVPQFTGLPRLVLVYSGLVRTLFRVFLYFWEIHTVCVRLCFRIGAFHQPLSVYRNILLYFYWFIFGLSIHAHSFMRIPLQVWVQVWLIAHFIWLYYKNCLCSEVLYGGFNLDLGQFKCAYYTNSWTCFFLFFLTLLQIFS